MFFFCAWPKEHVKATSAPKGALIRNAERGIANIDVSGSSSM